MTSQQICVAACIKCRLSVERLSSLIFISLVGPRPTKFNLLPYVKKGLAHGHRVAYNNQSRKHHATEESNYSHLNNIFEYATNTIIKINMPSAESNFSEMEMNLLKQHVTLTGRNTTGPLVSYVAYAPRYRRR